MAAVTRREVLRKLQREPFIPIQLRLTNRKTVRIREKRVACPVARGLLVVYPIKPGSRRISGFDVFAYASIERIEAMKMK